MRAAGFGITSCRAVEGEEAIMDFAAIRTGNEKTSI
jgi:hypothetical protein